MIQIQSKLPRDLYVACSGGVDSMGVVDFLRRNHNCTLMFFDHGTETSAEAKEFLIDYVDQKNREFWITPPATTLKLELGEISRTKEKSESWEEYWRKERYKWFHSLDKTIITCHHLDDCVETWIFNSLHGEGRIIPFRNQNVIRPFRANRKAEFVNWCRKNKVSWVEDTSNEDTRFMRNFIRKELIDKCLVVNPGLHKVIRKKVLEDGPETS
jgi:tRNA(Ile)-lysidine synthase